MKKLLSFVAIALLVMVMAIPAYAAANTTAYGGGTGLNTVKTVTTINTDAGGYDETNVSATTYFIPSKCTLIGYSVNFISDSGTTGITSIVDKASTTTSDADAYIVNEVECTAAYPVVKVFPQGLRLTRGLTIRQGCGTAVTVYYVQDRP